MSELNEIRQALADRLAVLQARLKKMEQDIQGPRAADFADQATEAENDEVLDALDVATRGEIVQLQAALARIDSGEYGRCDRCEGEIAAERLAALPHATSCIQCADSIA